MSLLDTQPACEARTEKTQLAAAAIAVCKPEPAVVRRAVRRLRAKTMLMQLLISRTSAPLAQSGAAVSRRYSFIGQRGLKVQKGC